MNSTNSTNPTAQNQPIDLTAQVSVLAQARLNRVLTGRLAHGADLTEALLTLCQAEGVQLGWVRLLGAVSRIKLAYYDQLTHRYEARMFDGMYEILNGTGNLSPKAGAPFLHLHVTLGDVDFNAFGGHVLPGDSCVFACEYQLTVLDSTADLNRDEQDADTGLGLWCPYLQRQHG